MITLWKDIMGFEDYQISNTGAIKRKAHTVRFKKERILRGSDNTVRRPNQIQLYNTKGERKYQSVDKLMKKHWGGKN